MEYLIRLSCLRQSASGACRAGNREHLRAWERPARITPTVLLPRRLAQIVFQIAQKRCASSEPCAAVIPCGKAFVVWYGRHSAWAKPRLVSNPTGRAMAVAGLRQQRSL